jgi:hypothetical protein
MRHATRCARAAPATAEGIDAGTCSERSFVMGPRRYSAVVTSAGAEHVSPDGRWRWDGHQWVPNEPPPPTPTPRERKRTEAATAAWEESPAGQARAARSRGDAIFVTTLDLAQHIPGGVFGTKTKDTPLIDPNVALNAVAQEGWRLVSATVAYVPAGSASLSAGAGLGSANLARGRTLGHYVFCRDSSSG